jgi:hypothetical protein
MPASPLAIGERPPGGPGSAATVAILENIDSPSAPDHGLGRWPRPSAMLITPASLQAQMYVAMVAERALAIAGLDPDLRSDRMHRRRRCENRQG